MGSRADATDARRDDRHLLCRRALAKEPKATELDGLQVCRDDVSAVHLDGDEIKCMEQRIGAILKSPETQMLQPMHSRMSSRRPSSIFFGRNGSAIDGRAAPIRSRMPRVICAAIMSGEV